MSLPCCSNVLARILISHYRYLELVRKIIKTYTLEPAGSHGVWGLDDHSFLPYIFGSAQYGPAIRPGDPTPIEGSHSDSPEPSAATNASVVASERTKNMYFSAIGFIYDVKKGPFWEHSPYLYDISGITAGWGKVNKVRSQPFMLTALTWRRACSRCTMLRSWPSFLLSSTSHLGRSSNGNAIPQQSTLRGPLIFLTSPLHRNRTRVFQPHRVHCQHNEQPCRHRCHSKISQCLKPRHHGRSEM